MFTLRQILEKKWEGNGTVHQLFIDFKKAYGSIKSEKLYSILIRFRIPKKKMVYLMKMCLSDPIKRLRIGNNMSDSFKIRKRLKKGDELSPLLFNFVLEYAILKIKEKIGLSLNGLNQLSVYGDDLDLIGYDIDVLRKNTDDLVEACYEIGLEVNIDKTKYMITS